MTSPGGPQPKASETTWTDEYTRYTWHDEVDAGGNPITTYSEVITYYATNTGRVTRVTAENTSTLHTGLVIVYDQTMSVVQQVNITAPFPLTQWDLTGLHLNIATDTYALNLAMKG